MRIASALILLAAVGCGGGGEPVTIDFTIETPPPVPKSPEELRQEWGGDHSPIGLVLVHSDGSRQAIYGSASPDIPNKYGVRWWPDTPPLEEIAPAEGEK